MSGRKETPVRPPGYKPSATTKSSKSASKSVLSKEVVSESDDSQDAGSEAKDDSSSDGSSGSSDEEDEESHVTPVNVAPSTPFNRATASTQEPETTNPRRRTSFAPPSGFHPGSTSNTGTSTAAKLLTERGLRKKQAWYITAPASVPITAIAEFSLASLGKGEAGTKHNGVDYCFRVESSPHQSANILIPDTTGEQYQTASLRLAKTLHLQRISNQAAAYQQRGQILDAQQATARASAVTSKAPRQQPPNLKMRYRPVGVPVSEASGGTSEAESAEGADDMQAQFQIPRGFEGGAEPRKRKHADANGRSENEERNSQHKKAKRDGAQDGSHMVSSPHPASDAVDGSNGQSLSIGAGDGVQPPRDYQEEEHQVNRARSSHRRETSAERAERKKRKQAEREGKEERRKETREKKEKRRKDMTSKDGGNEKQGSENIDNDQAEVERKDENNETENVKERDRQVEMKEQRDEKRTKEKEERDKRKREKKEKKERKEMKRKERAGGRLEGVPTATNSILNASP